MSRTTTRGLAVLTAGLVLTGAAACGSGVSSKPPKDELTSSFDALSDSKELTVTVKLDATAAELQDLAAANGDKLDSRVANLVAGADVKAQLSGEKKFKDYRPDDLSTPSFDLSVDLDGGPVVDLRTVSKVLYIKADVQKVLTIAQQPKLMEELTARAASLPPFVQAAVAGKWISFPVDQAKALAGQLGGSAAATPSATPSAAQSTQFIEQLKAIVSKDVTVKRLSTGGEKGDHLQLSASTRALLTDVTGAASSLVPGAGGLSQQLNSNKTPDRTVTVDAYVKNGKLSELSFDLAQLATGADAAKMQGKHLPLVMHVDDTAGSIDKPADATPVDLGQILPLLGAFSGGSSSSGAATATPLATSSP